MLIEHDLFTDQILMLISCLIYDLFKTKLLVMGMKLKLPAGKHSAGLIAVVPVLMPLDLLLGANQNRLFFHCCPLVCRRLCTFCSWFCTFCFRFRTFCLCTLRPCAFCILRLLCCCLYRPHLVAAFSMGMAGNLFLLTDQKFLILIAFLRMLMGLDFRQAACQLSVLAITVVIVKMHHIIGIPADQQIFLPFFLAVAPFFMLMHLKLAIKYALGMIQCMTIEHQSCYCPGNCYNSDTCNCNQPLFFLFLLVNIFFTLFHHRICHDTSSFFNPLPRTLIAAKYGALLFLLHVRR